jgi:hypothetical protein
MKIQIELIKKIREYETDFRTTCNDTGFGLSELGGIALKMFIDFVSWKETERYKFA